MPLSGANRHRHLAVIFQRLGPMAYQQVLLHLQVCCIQALLDMMAHQEAAQPIGALTNLALQRLEFFWAGHQLGGLLHLMKRVEGFLYLPGVIALLVGQTRLTRHVHAPLVPQNLWSIIGDSGYIVSSLLPSTAAWHSVHIPTGKMGTRPVIDKAELELVKSRHGVHQRVSPLQDT